MHTVTIAPVTDADIPTVAALARSIWFEHYPGIISPAQIHYMLERGYGHDVIAREIASGIEWWLASIDGQPQGFAAFGVEGGFVKLHKLYVTAAARGTGIGKRLVLVVADATRRRGIDRIVLAVNKRNHTAIRAYLAMGFSFRRAVLAQIGHGFVMDDYVMARPA